MSQVETAVDSSVVSVYPDHGSAEAALRRLIEAGFAMKDVSIVGRDFQVKEEPIGFHHHARLRRGGSGNRRVGRRAVRPADRCGVLGSAGSGAGDCRRAALGGAAGRTGGGTRRRGDRRAASPEPWSAGVFPRTRR